MPGARSRASSWSRPRRRPPPRSPARPTSTPRRFTEEPITVGARDWPLPGTLTRPKGVASAPLVILVHGSGPNDRDETIGPNKPFRDLAQGLATRGIAVIRYDKRTLEHKQRYSKDKKAADAVTIEEEVVADALATAAKARNLPGIDPRRIFVLGHSEGGALAPLIARRDGHLAGVILLAASNRPPDELIRDQLGYIKTLDPSKAEEVGKMQKDIEAGLERIKSGKARDDERIVGASPRFWKSWQGSNRPGSPASSRVSRSWYSRVDATTRSPGSTTTRSTPPSAADRTPRSTSIPTSITCSRRGKARPSPPST